MAHFEEQTDQPYAWDDRGVYVIEREDPVDGGLDGVSNRQGRELTQRTRNLHGRLSVAEGEIDTLQEELPIAAEQAQNVAVGLAKAHTDGQVSAVRNELAVGDQAALRSAKEYADRIVAALVDGSPEMLNTLEELAAALGGDPNFATTVMQAIGERATMSEVNTALAGKANTNHGHAANDLSGVFKAVNAVVNADDVQMGIAQTSNGMGLVSLFQSYYNELQFAYSLNASMHYELRYRLRNNNTGAYQPWHLFVADFDPNTKANTSHTHKASDLTGVFKAIDVIQDANDMGMGIAHSGGRGVVTLHQNSYNELQFDYPFDAAKQGAQLRFRQRNNDNAGRFPWYDIYHSGNLKIIRGAVRADGNPAGGSGFNSYKSGEAIYVQHGLGHSQFVAVATVFAPANNHRDNVVTVIYKDSTNVCFQVTAGPDQEVEWAPFDFIIMPY